MAQVSIGRLENLDDLMRGLLSVGEGLEASCREQIAVAESKYGETCEEAQASERAAESAIQQEQAAQRAVERAQRNLESGQSSLSAANSACSACVAQPRDENGTPPDCSSEESVVADAESAVQQAQAESEQARADLEQAQEYRQAMEQRVELAKQAQAMAHQIREQARQECNVRQASVNQAIEVGISRLTVAQQALNAYLSINPSAEQFHTWLKWSSTQHTGPITPNLLRERMNLSPAQLRNFQEYLYDRDPAYRGLTEKYRGAWAVARGDAERNIVARKARVHLCSAFSERMARYALAPLGERIETQGRTYVGDKGRYTKTDLIVSDLRVPVILGRGAGMAAPAGGSMAFEVKCGKSKYLFSEKDHMVFQAEGHKQADAQCTFCSRDIHDLSLEKEKELRDALREAGSPLVGMLPRKRELDQSCLEFIREGEEEKL